MTRTAGTVHVAVVQAEVSSDLAEGLARTARRCRVSRKRRASWSSSALSRE
ncbi:MAG: hypothetical protein Q7S20_06425 [Gemmatimonadaceae bacterium]|nr:hypothetical protein [Gemmatimonadaceae bacterium]